MFVPFYAANMSPFNSIFFNSPSNLALTRVAFCSLNDRYEHEDYPVTCDDCTATTAMKFAGHPGLDPNLPFALMDFATFTPYLTVGSRYLLLKSDFFPIEYVTLL